MDSLLSALVGCLLGEMGDKSQLLLLALAIRFNRDGAIIAGMVVAAVANAAISAAAGGFIGPLLGGDARLLFLSLSIVFLGIGMLWPIKEPDTLSGWRLGPFLTSTLGLFILGFGDGPQFLILGIAARSGDPVLAGIGGAIGIIAAGLPIVLMRQRFYAVMPLRAVRIGGACVLLLTGAIAAVIALRLV